MVGSEAETAPADAREQVSSRLRRTASTFLGDFPRLYYPVMRRRGRYRDLLIRADTEVVIEGFPRSGNTFAVAALQFAQGRPIGIARHTHYPAQVIEAARRRLPTLVLVREPADAVVSLVIREPFVTLEQALRRYLHYYTKIAPYHGSYVVGTFHDVTTDFGCVVAGVNRAFRTQFVRFEHTDANCTAVFQIVEDMERQACRGVLEESRVARPSAERAIPKARLLEALGDPQYRELSADCEAVFHHFATLSEPSEAPRRPSSRKP
jgi:hypothetical protein